MPVIPRAACGLGTWCAAAPGRRLVRCRPGGAARLIARPKSTCPAEARHRPPPSHPLRPHLARGAGAWSLSKPRLVANAGAAARRATAPHVCVLVQRAAEPLTKTRQLQPARQMHPGPRAGAGGGSRWSALGVAGSRLRQDPPSSSVASRRRGAPRAGAWRTHGGTGAAQKRAGPHAT